MIITIDGPTASGKSTTAQLLAHKLGFSYLNSGFLYRAFAFILMHEKGYTLKNLNTLTDDDIRAIHIDLLSYTRDIRGNPCIQYNGQDITRHLKSSPDIDQASSIISAYPLVRKLLLDVQREIGKKQDLVIDGRDAGSVVFPNAEFKFYLTAALETRALRWMHDQMLRGKSMSLQEAIRQLQIRDERDMTRSVAPLEIPRGAMVIDNGDYTLQETVELVYRQIRTSQK